MADKRDRKPEIDEIQDVNEDALTNDDVVGEGEDDEFLEVEDEEIEDEEDEKVEE